MKALSFTVNRTGDEVVDRNLDQLKRSIDSIVAVQASLASAGATLTNLVALTGMANVLPDFTNGVTYATDYANLHATISQLCAKVTALEAKLVSLTH